MLNDPIESVPAKRPERRKPNADGPRGRYSLDLKLEVLKETFAPGASVAAVARRHGMNTNVIFRWRKLFREGRLTGEPGPNGKKSSPPAFAPVRLVPDVADMPRGLPVPRPPAPEPKPAARKAGVVAITLPGGFTLRASEDIDDAALRRVLKAVRDLR